MTTILIILMITTIIVLIGFVIGACYYLDRIQDHYDKISFTLDLMQVSYKQLKDSYDYANKILEKGLALFEAYEEFYKNIDQQHETIKDQYNIMMEAFKRMSSIFESIGMQYATITNNTKALGERYDNIYEEFRHCTDELVKFRAVLEPWCIDSDQLEEETTG